MASVHSGSITIRAAMQHDFNPKDDLLVPVWLDSQNSIALFPSTGGPTHTVEKMVLAAPLTECTETNASKITVGICYRTPGRGTMCNSSAGEVSIEAVVVQGPAQISASAINGGDSAAIGEALYVCKISSKWTLATHTSATKTTFADTFKIGLVMNTHSDLQLVDILL